jgi:DNA repair exonuclease SbcCD ATPase subunit
MIELLSLQFGNFRSFVDDQFISFENREKLIQIDGIIEGTKGSSGAGKSTIPLALMYLLDLADLPSTVLQSRFTKDGMWAIGKFKFDGVPVTISRSKKEGLKIELPEETVSGNSKLAEEKLEQLIGIPKKIFRKMILKKQKEVGFFLSMTPKEMYEFLIAVLGLEIHIAEIQKITENIDACEEKMKDLAREVELAKSSLQDMERILAEKKKPVPTVHPDEIKQLNHGVLAIRANIGSLKMETQEQVDAIPKPQELVANTSEINSKIAAIVPSRVALNAKLEGIDNSKKALEASLTKIPFAIADAQKTGAEISKIRAEKEHMEKSQCPTCLQVWVGDTVQQKIEKAESTIQYLIQEALRFKAIIDEKPQHEENLARLLKIREGVTSELAALADQRSALDAEKYAVMEDVSKKNEILRNEYRTKVTETENRYKHLIEKLNADLKQVEIDLAAKESQHNSYLTTSIQYEKEVATLNEIVVKKKSEASQKNLELDRLQKQIVVAQESKRMIKAYVLQTFQETLDAIGEAATEIMSGVPNMATSTIYFEGCKETKSGTIKDEVVAIINMDGNNEIPIKSLSGGEETTTNLAVDLAVIDVIETKVAKGANFIFMDEPFEGLDTLCKENVLEILKALDTNKKIIMVDHSSELKEMVSDVILVVKKGETSTIAS